MKQYPLPNGWRWAKLGDICETITDGTHHTPSYIKSGIPFLSVKNVRETGLDFENVQYISAEDHEELKKRCNPQKGDVLYTKVGTTGIAKAIDFDREFSIFVSVALLKPNHMRIDTMYLEKVLNSPICREQAKALTQGVGNQNLVLKDLMRIEMPLPPLPEQRRIAAKIQDLMQEVDHAHAACERQLEAANALPAAYLRSVFESEEAKKWERKGLSDVCEIIMGQSPSSDSYNREKLGLPFFQGKADFGDYFPTPQIWCSAPTKIAEPNDVLISVRAPVGPVNLSNQECCIGRGLCALRPNDEIDSWFLFFYQKEIENSWKGRGSTFEAIKKHDLDTIKVPVPPQSVQKRIVSEIRKEMSISKHLQSITQVKMNSLDAIRKAIFKRAFRGGI